VTVTLTAVASPSPDDDPQQPGSGGGRGDGARFWFVPGSVLDGVEVSGPIPPEALARRVSPDGLDWQALIDALAMAGKIGSDPEGLDEAAAEADGRMGAPDPGIVAALAVEHMPAGPALAGWLEVATAASGRLDEDLLTGVAIAADHLAAHTQAARLTAVAQLTARAAAADRSVGVEADGRPAEVTRDAAGQLEMALMLSHNSAQALAHLAVTLTWRLADTGAALAAGRIDLTRARLIAEYTSVLPEDKAQLVEARVLPAAAGMTYAQLRQRLTVLVIAVDPAGAEERRKNAERHADVRLYGDDDQTASLVASKLPQVLAAAGYARINALARARKAAGLPGGMPHHRAAVLFELILGTLNLIPPADGDPGQPLPPDDTPPPLADDPPPPPGGTPPGRPPARDTPADDTPARDTPADDTPADDTPADDSRRHKPPRSDAPHRSDSVPGQDRGPGRDAGAGQNAPDQDGGTSQDEGGQDGPGHAGPEGDGGAAVAGDCNELPEPRDEDAPEDDGLVQASQEDPGPVFDPWEEDDLDDARPLAWPRLGTIPAALARASRREGGTPPAGLLDVTLPWTTYARLGNQPATLGRIGAITAAQARQLTQAAEHDPAAQWRIIITGRHGHAITVTRLRLRRRAGRRSPSATGPPGTGARGTGPPGAASHSGQQPAGPSPPSGAGLTGRVTLIISQDTISRWQPAAGSGAGPPGRIARAALATAARALQRAREQARADTQAGGCAHTSASAAYRPPTRLREHVIARDLTCRNPVCGQPAWRADLDHTHPWDQGGPTCTCNLGGACRRDHQLKQHPRWKLQQTRPGWFRWTAPSGRTYQVRPQTYLT
jgi:hypothetical protein